jgi:hypothetical protein
MNADETVFHGLTVDEDLSGDRYQLRSAIAATAQGNQPQCADECNPGPEYAMRLVLAIY